MLVFALGLALAARKSGVPRHARVAFDLIVAAVLVQVTLGIATLLMFVPVSVAAAHQGNAALVLGAALYANYALRRWPEHVELPADVRISPSAVPLAT